MVVMSTPLLQILPLSATRRCFCEVNRTRRRSAVDRCRAVLCCALPCRPDVDEDEEVGTAAGRPEAQRVRFSTAMKRFAFAPSCFRAR